MKLLLLIFLALLFMIPAYAQIHYSYDPSGNRTTAQIEIRKFTETSYSAVNKFQDSIFQNSIKIYPNPAVNSIFINSQLSENINLSVFDLNGKLLMQRNMLNFGEVSLKELSPGNYIIVAEQNSKRAVWRLVKAQPN